MPAPPSTAPNWQQYNHGAPTAYRSPADTLLPGSPISTTPQAGAIASAPTGDPLQASQALPPRTPYGSTLGANPPASPSLLPESFRPGDPSSSNVRRASYEQMSQPPLRGVPSDVLSRPENGKNVPAPTVTPTPLLMAMPDRIEKPVGDPVSPASPKTQGTGADDTTPHLVASQKPPSGMQVEEKSPPAAPMPEKFDEVSSQPKPDGSKTSEEKCSGSPASPAWRMVNSKRIVLNYELKDVGPSGVSAVEMWQTRDGQVWKKDETTGHSGPPYVIEVPEEGQYGFTMVARNGIGLGKEPPKPGDLPQVWVQVDMTRPMVKLLDVKHGTGSKARDVAITWDAHDRNMARRPITLSFATAAEGPWLPFAANIENSGHHTWSMPQTGPASFFIRVEAVDMVGNVGVAQSTQATSIDTSHPTVSILGVESSEK